MKVTKVLTLTGPLLLAAATAHAAGTFPGAGALTTVETWCTGTIAEFMGIMCIAGIAVALWWAAHEYSHIFGWLFRGFLAICFIVFAITIYTTAFGAGASIVPATGLWWIL